MVQVSTIGRLSETALNNLKSCITHIGEQEGLPHHVEAAKSGLKNNSVGCCHDPLLSHRRERKTCIISPENVLKY